jgi:hypothetical protein
VTLHDSPGGPVRVVMTKWGDLPHWEYDAALLGRDPHGDWVGIPAGTPMGRPGATFTPPVDSVLLVPSGGSGWLATFYAPGFRVEVYVDITSPPRWDGPLLRATDLDLDVVRGEKGRVWVDDEDEFAAHRLTLGYPEELVAEASRTCTAVHAAVVDRTPPFDRDTPAGWLAHLR